MVSGYCVKCKAKRDMKDTKEEKTKRGAIMVRGTCTKCGTKMVTFVSAKKSK